MEQLSHITPDRPLRGNQKLRDDPRGERGGGDHGR